MPKFERYNKYEVIKLEDAQKYLTGNQKEKLQEIIKSIQWGRKGDGKVPCNSYVVVNEDQPYAEQVWGLIKEQWEKDNKQECLHLHKWHNPGYADNQMKCLDCGEENV